MMPRSDILRTLDKAFESYLDGMRKVREEVVASVKAHMEEVNARTEKGKEEESPKAISTKRP